MGRRWVGNCSALGWELISLLAEKIALEVSSLQWGEFHFEPLSLPAGHDARAGLHREGGQGSVGPAVHGAVQGAGRVQCALAELVFLGDAWGQREGGWGAAPVGSVGSPLLVGSLGFGP